MDKFAQKRSVLNQLREKINMPGNYLEGFFKPELDRVMTSLKELDDRIRAALTGQKIGNAEGPKDGLAAKDLVKSARTNFNRREYIAGLVDLGNFHKKMFDITQDISKFFVDVNKIHNKFLFEGLPKDYQDNLKSLREHMSTKAEFIPQAYFIKQAGIMDFFYNVGTKRGRSLAAWEKKYPKQTRDLREGGSRLVEDAQKLLDNTLANLKQMGTARATRGPDEYMDVANKIKGDFERFDGGDKGFKAYYNNVIMPFLKIKDSIDQMAPKPETPAAQPPVDNSTKTELGSIPSPQPTEQEPVFPLVNQAPIQVQDSEIEEVAPETQRNPPMGFPDKPPITAHQSFYHSLQALSQEEPVILAGYISKYARSIQDNDPETAINLFAIARQVRS